jgi:hypothetical protein
VQRPHLKTPATMEVKIDTEQDFTLHFDGFFIVYSKENAGLKITMTDSKSKLAILPNTDNSCTIVKYPNCEKLF